MNQRIKDYLRDYNSNRDWGVTDKDLMETVVESPELYSEKKGSHRWYDDYFYVVNVGGLLFGYNGFYMTGDNNMQDMDLEYDINTVVEVVPKEKTITVYEPKSD